MQSYLLVFCTNNSNRSTCINNKLKIYLKNLLPQGTIIWLFKKIKMQSNGFFNNVFTCFAFNPFQ